MARPAWAAAPAWGAPPPPDQHQSPVPPQPPVPAQPGPPPGPRPVSPWSYGPTAQPGTPTWQERPGPASGPAAPSAMPSGPMPSGVTPSGPEPSGPTPSGPAAPGVAAPQPHKATGIHQMPLRDVPPAVDPDEPGRPEPRPAGPPPDGTYPAPTSVPPGAGHHSGNAGHPDTGGHPGVVGHSGVPTGVPRSAPPAVEHGGQPGRGAPTGPAAPSPAGPAAPPYGHPGSVYTPGMPPGQPGPALPPPGHPAPGHPAPGHPAPGHPAPGQPAPGAPGGPYGGPPSPGRPPTVIPTAEEFARRRAVRPPDPVATMGVRAAVNKTTLGLVKMRPGRYEQEIKHDIEMVRRNFGGLRQVTVVNPKGGAGKTVAILLLAMTFGQKRGGYVLAWDNNETQGTLGMRAQQDFHSRTVRDLLRDLDQFRGTHGRVGDLSQYVRAQGEGMFDVLASDESATAGEMLTRMAFGDIREVVSRFYKLIFVDTGNNVRAENWQAAIDATDQLVVTMSARNDSAEPAARMLDHLEQTGRQRLVRQAITVVSMPPSRKEIDLPAIERHFSARTRAVLLAPYERLIDSGEPVRYGQLSTATRDAWLKIAAAVAVGL
ncbi:chromosome partitioning protein [Polymorphospora sp. NPDC051019]|uniref:MinD/ParA family ATP-binding protein n=1 Tax=Polymorphospora sp. NPDC051019 TaxID=3155725 RepID=UPI003446AA69